MVRQEDEEEEEEEGGGRSAVEPPMAEGGQLSLPEHVPSVQS